MNQLYSFIDINIIFFNVINFLAGLFIITYNLKGLEDCSNIILLSTISSLNSLITISWCINMCNNRFCSFFISLALLIYNVNNYNNLGDNCVNYFHDSAQVLWYFYITNIFLQIFNVISYTLLFYVAIVILNRKPRRSNINIDSNLSIYDDDLSLLNEDIEKII